MSDQAGPAEQAHPGSDEPAAAAPKEKETEAAAQAEALAKMEDQWRRALADNDNLRKRAVRDGAQQRAQERAAVALAWLPILDNLELALAHAPAGAEDPLVEGIASIRKQAIDTLARLGYPRIDAENRIVILSHGRGSPPGSPRRRLAGECCPGHRSQDAARSPGSRGERRQFPLH